MVKFGIAYDALGDGLEELLGTVRLAEELGFDSVWFGETHRRRLGHGHAPAPLIACAAVAAATRRIQIGTAVLLPPMYTPLEIAEQAAMVDQYSNGRLLLGVGTGLEVWHDFGWGNLTFSKPQLQTIMDESLTVIRRLWTEDEVSYSGEIYKYENAACVPKPYQRPHPPIYVGGITKRSTARAAELGEGWIGGTPYPYPLMISVRKDYEAAAHERGQKPGEFVLIRPIVAEADDQTAARAAENYVRPILQYYLKRGAIIGYDYKKITQADDPVYQASMDEIPIVGSAATCIKKLQFYVETVGVTHFILRIRYPGQSHADIQNHLRFLARHVLPYFRGA